MIKKQRLVVIGLGVADLIVLFLLCAAVFGLFGGQTASAPPAPTPHPTTIPTWTPTSTLLPPASSTPSPVPPTASPFTIPLEMRRSLADDESLDQIEREVAALRGLEPRRPVPRWAIAGEQLRTYYVEPILDERSEQLYSLSLALIAFDMMEPGVGLAPLLKYSLPESIAGFYDPMAGEIYIVSASGVVGEYERSVFAHEYAHALQDQHFGLLALGFDELGFTFDRLDRFNAIRALVEGDAELVEDQYAGALPSDDAMALSAFPGAWGLGPAALSSESAGRRLQPPIGEVFSFPYTYGEIFVRVLHDRGGWGAVNEAYADLPASTEQILHPERYLAGDAPVIVSVAPLTDTLGGGWRLVFDDPVGEFMLGVYLQNQLTADETAIATEGWGGDLGVVYCDSATGELVMVLRSVWDTSLDSGEFLNAYRVYADRRFGHPADQGSGGTWCWYGDDALCVTWEGDWVTVVLGPDRSTVAEVLIAVSE
jgi:hypothetical protein